jgi:phosphoribosylpyrophosphate synthetase
MIRTRKNKLKRHSEEPSTAVVREDPKGNATTSLTRSVSNQNVIIVDDVIHVPQRCIGRKGGNAIKC